MHELFITFLPSQRRLCHYDGDDDDDDDADNPPGLTSSLSRLLSFICPLFRLKVGEGRRGRDRVCVLGGAGLPLDKGWR